MRRRFAAVEDMPFGLGAVDVGGVGAKTGAALLLVAGVLGALGVGFVWSNSAIACAVITSSSTSESHSTSLASSARMKENIRVESGLNKAAIRISLTGFDWSRRKIATALVDDGLPNQFGSTHLVRHYTASCWLAPVVELLELGSYGVRIAHSGGLRMDIVGSCDSVPSRGAPG
jgi:hypothetical protein